MKTFRRILILIIATAALALVARAAISDVDIHVTPKGVDSSPPRSEGGDSRMVSIEHWNYEVTIENKTFKPMEAIEVKYMVFYKTEELGTRTPAVLQHKSGTLSIDALKPHEKKSFVTNTVELKKSHLIGSYYFSGGERIKAEDTLSGVWVRVSQGGQQIGEYANPSILTKEKWE